MKKRDRGQSPATRGNGLLSRFRRRLRGGGSLLTVPDLDGMSDLTITLPGCRSGPAGVTGADGQPLEGLAASVGSASPAGSARSAAAGSTTGPAGAVPAQASGAAAAAGSRSGAAPLSGHPLSGHPLPGAQRPAGQEIIGGPNWSHLPALDSVLALTGVERRRARQVTRKELDWHGKFVIAHLGTMGLKQGLESLAPALRHLAGVQPDVLVSFIGNGSQREALRQATAGLANVEIRDPAPADQQAAVLLAADLLLVSEQGVGSGIVVPSTLQAYFSSGRPVLAVVPEGSGTAVELESSGAGVRVAPDDPLGFTAQVALLRADPDCRTRLGDAGMRYAEQLLSRQPA